jgi:dienelactone hydrolase
MDGTYPLQGVLIRPSNPSPAATQDLPFVLMRLREPGTLASPVLSPDVLFWLSKGWSVFDFDCGGYHARGRQYSKRVQQNLFAADVLSLAQQLLRKKHAAPGRLFLSGACPLAGMCALECVLSQRNVFAGVVCTAALTDLEAFYQEADDRVLMHAAGLLDSFPPQWLPPTQETKKSWLPRSLALRANDLKVPVLLCHGRSDSIVPVTQTEKFECASGNVNKYIVVDGDDGLWDHSIPSSLAFLDTQWRFLAHGTAPDMNIASQPGMLESKKQSQEAESSAIILQKRDLLVAATVLAAVLVVGLGVYGLSRRRQELPKY